MPYLNNVSTTITRITSIEARIFKLNSSRFFSSCTLIPKRRWQLLILKPLMKFNIWTVLFLYKKWSRLTDTVLQLNKFIVRTSRQISTYEGISSHQLIWTTLTVYAFEFELCTVKKYWSLQRKVYKSNTSIFNICFSQYFHFYLMGLVIFDEKWNEWN